MLDELVTPATMAMAGPRSSDGSSVVVGEEAYPSLFKALGVIGPGRRRVISVPADDQGRMRVDALPRLTPPVILCLQAGNVNSGAFDPMAEIVPAAREAGAWVRRRADDAAGHRRAPAGRHHVRGSHTVERPDRDAHLCQQRVDR